MNWETLLKAGSHWPNSEMDWVELLTGDVQGFIFGSTIRRESNYIRIDAGVDSTAVPPSTPLPGFLRESGYMIEIDNRLGHIVAKQGDVTLNPATIDDDNIAQYILTTKAH